MFVNKYQTYLYYSPFFKREVVPIMRESDNFTEFESFIINANIKLIHLNDKR